ncbi:MAG: response regulator [Anaerolineales bacterium]|nr:response regulator [Anaerolineales bacterium]MDW8277650.1 response regulator [Anaerolineales bacterium]
MNISPCHILLIEDNPLDADLIKRAIQKAEPGIVLEIASDGEEALSYLDKWEKGGPTPTVILLDLKLPKVSGLDVLHRLKTHPVYKLLPVVVLTSSNEVFDIRQAYTLGANSYILKAIDYDQFSNAISLIHRYWCGLNIYPE